MRTPAKIDVEILLQVLLVLGWHDDRVDGVDDAIARRDIPLGDVGATDAKCVAVFRDRRALTLHHLRSRQFLDLDGRCPTWQHVVFQHGNQFCFVLRFQPVFQCALGQLVERLIRRRKKSVRPRAFENVGQFSGFERFAQRME